MGDGMKATKVNDFRDLRVWQSAMEIVELVYRLTQQFPRSEMYGLTGQMRRAVVSVPSNIAEGHARQHLREYLHFLSVAQASLGEMLTQVEIAKRLEYISVDTGKALIERIDILRKQLRALRNSLVATTDMVRETLDEDSLYEV